MKEEIKSCQNCKKEFTIESKDFEFYKKIKVPAPTWCPDCRLTRRLIHRNERSLYKDKCNSCQKNIISMYNPQSKLKVYCHDCYYSDDWDATEYGQEYNFSKPFFEQFIELQKKVPQLFLFQKNNIDSPWVNYEGESKKCYLNIGGHQNEDSAYNQYLLQGKDCFDNFWLFNNSSYSYENILSGQNYQTFNSIFCYSCRDTYYSFDCKNCSNIIGCSNLRNQQYQIFNQVVTKEEFQEFKNKYLDGSYQKRKELEKMSKKFWQTQPQRLNFIQKSINSNGDLIKESKNIKNGLIIEKSEDVSNGLYLLESKDSIDITSAWKVNNCYEVLSANLISDVKFSMAILDNSTNIEYSSSLLNQNDYCFGCVGVSKKKYCILNKQYSKEEYFRMVEKIKKQMDEIPFKDKKGRVYKYGEFFPPEASLFDYKDTVAYEWFPKTKLEMEEWGLNNNLRKEENVYEFSDYEILDNISDVGDDILKKVLKCEKSGKAYRIIKMELEFYRRFNIPIPHLAPFERHKQRLSFLVARQKNVNRKCEKCHQEIKSIYSEKEFPKVYCEKCYQQEVI